MRMCEGRAHRLVVLREVAAIGMASRRSFMIGLGFSSCLFSEHSSYMYHKAENMGTTVWEGYYWLLFISRVEERCFSYIRIS